MLKFIKFEKKYVYGIKNLGRARMSWDEPTFFLQGRPCEDNYFYNVGQARST